MAGAIDVALEGHAFFRDLAHGGKREDLKASGVCEDRPVPAHERMEAAEPGHQLIAGAQPQVIGVAENDLGANLLELGGGHAFDGSLRAHGHEGRGSDNAMTGSKVACTGLRDCLDGG